MSGVQAAPFEEAYRRLAGNEPDLGLFTKGGPFESFPGPVLVVGRNGVVLGANEPAEPLARLIRAGGSPQLLDALNAALDGRAAQISPLLLPANKALGEPARAYDLMALPWADAPAALLLVRDITLERSLRAALVESRQLYKDLIEACSDFIWESDRQGCFSFISDQGALGYAAEELVGQKVADHLLMAGDLSMTPFAAQAPVRQAEVWFKDQDKRSRCLQVMSLPLFDGAGDWAGCRGFCREVVGRQDADQAGESASRRNNLFAYMMRNAFQEFLPLRILARVCEDVRRSLPVSSVEILWRRGDQDFETLAEAGAGENLPTESYDALLERLKNQPQSEQEEGGVILLPTLFRGQPNGALVIRHQLDVPLWKEEERLALTEVAGQVAFFIEAKQLDEELLALSSSDALTGLSNRRGFLDSLKKRLARAASGAEQGVLFFVDIDEFKGLNDTRGHRYGDQVLVRLAELLTGMVREGDLVGRLGGDEFALFINGIDAEAAEIKIAALKQAALASGGPVEPFHVSVGAAALELADQVTARPESPEALMARADEAMYEMKHAGRAKQRSPAGQAAGAGQALPFVRPGNNS